MPLGTAKDSIADLQNLVRGAGLEDDFTRAPAASMSPSSSADVGAAADHGIDIDDDDDDNFIIGADDEVEESVNLPPMSLPLHQASLVERSEAMAAAYGAQGKQYSFRGVMELPINGNQQGANDMNSYIPGHETANSGLRIKKSSQKKSKATTTTYTNYDYTDYYAESYDDKNHISSSPPKKKHNNVLTCLFPFLQDPLNSDSDSDYDDGNSSNSYSNSSSNSASISTSQSEKSITSTPSVSLSVSGSANGSVKPLATGHFDRDSIDVRKSQATKKLSVDASTSAASASDQVNVVSTPSTSASSTPEPEHIHDEKAKASSSSSSSSSSSTTSANPQDSTANSLPRPPLKKPLKGILKRSVMRQPSSSTTKAPTESLQKTLYKNSLRSRDEINLETQNVRRRSILPTYSNDSLDGNFNHDGSSNSNGNKKKKVEFSTMARVLPVLARGDMSFYTKSLIWWQRNDYDDFKKTGRIIAKAMLQGGSEIWLQTSNAWGRQQSKPTAKATATNAGLSKMNQTTATTGGGRKYNAEYLSALKRYGVKIDEDHDGEEKKIHDHDDDDLKEKWWCKFGHSRRGLEHIVSIQEGRQRQKLVNSSIQSVLEEQRRQRISSRKDPQKIASISRQYTSWARDLALAAGEADEEAVRKNFHSKAKGRLAYLSSKLLSRGRTSASTAVEGQPCASLILSANPAVTAGLLDSHTHNAKLLLKQEKEKRRELEQRATAVMKNDHNIAHQAAGFQFQGAVSS